MADTREVPGVLRWLVSCDESGVHGSPCYGFGTLFMRYQRRGDLNELIQELRLKHRYRDEIKWNHVKAKHLPFYRELVEMFFKAPWMGFHCFVVPRAVVRRELHASWDEARQKHFGLLLRTKILGCLEAHKDRVQTIRVHVDPMHSSYSKAVEVVQKVTTAVVQRQYPNVTIEGAFEIDSKQSLTIQLCDVLLGAVMSEWDREPAEGAKSTLRLFIARHLGWNDLHSDTHASERKFNVWMFHDSQGKRSRVVTRPVKLRYPLPIRQRS